MSSLPQITATIRLKLLASTTIPPSLPFRLPTFHLPPPFYLRQHEIWAATGLVAHPYLGPSPPRRLGQRCPSPTQV
ncbi:UNVERIFIED_CONTAM: hypothetical protein Sradi_5021100 [Sesamum radiatum]|uniref:Uncharacterized protein n=1 Tax=Sesamum radiatum TaxID=300843 RepID=A0AAW2MFQ6_SESRA